MKRSEKRSRQLIDQKEITDYVTKNSEKPAHAFVSRDLLSLTGKISRSGRQFIKSG